MGLYGEPLADTLLVADDLVGVARTLKRAGKVDEALDVATRAIEAGASPESLRVRGEIAKARGDRARALADFEELSGQVDCGRARLELAKLYEHFAKDLDRARAVVLAGTAEKPEQSARRARRIEGKLEKRSKKAQPELFPRSKKRAS
jgi:tetratricopeptide (TPR) repeat protein